MKEKQLFRNQPACINEHKAIELCGGCLRNMAYLNAIAHGVFDTFELRNVKNFATGVHFKCDGYIPKAWQVDAGQR